MSARRRLVGRPPRQKPYPRTYPNGRRVRVARCYDLDGKTQYAKPRRNGGKSTFALEGDAQRAIYEPSRSYMGPPRLQGNSATTASIGWKNTRARPARMISVYTHGLHRSHDRIRRIIG